MEFTIIVLGGIVGTALMTIFSYVCGKILSKEFGEPKLLNKLLNRTFQGDKEINEDSPLGWIVHFAIGILFAWMMYLCFLWMDALPSWPIGGLLGFAFGILGAVGWASVLSFHPSPPDPERPEFYFQLVVAHVVFGLATVFVFNAINGLI